MSTFEHDLGMIARNTSPQLVHFQVAEVLRRYIILGELKDGERLVEEQIAQKAGVSRIPVREALRLLEAENLVINIPRRGIYVVGISDDDIREIFRIRCMIECLACEYIIEGATKEQLEEGHAILENALDLLTYNNFENTSFVSQTFNEWIGETCGSRRIMVLHRQYNNYIRIFREINSDRNPERRKQALLEHLDIWNALNARDKVWAQRAVKIHSERSMEALISQRETQK